MLLDLTFALSGLVTLNSHCWPKICPNCHMAVGLHPNTTEGF